MIEEKDPMEIENVQQEEIIFLCATLWKRQRGLIN